jgi:leucyl/phenylalanyl-tRNA--protein transferase
MSRGPALTADLLLQTYTQGIFPMGVGGRICWFQPDPRAILPLEGFRASKTLRQTVRSGRFEIRIDTAFEDVMRGCADRADGTWIDGRIVRVYGELFERGHAHSVEAWRAGRLAGGLYGVSLGGAFFGESMFHRQRDASKVVLAALVARLRERGFSLLDIQFLTPHLEQFGAIEIPHGRFMKLLRAALALPARFGE